MKGKTALKIGAASVAVVGAACAAGGKYFVDSFLGKDGIARRANQTMLSDENHELLTASGESDAGLDFYRKMPYEDVFTYNGDSERLRAIFYKAAKPTDVYVIACHGYTGSPEKYNVVTHRFYEMGFNVLAPYLRAHGKSEHKYCSMGWFERYDVIEWIKFIIEQNHDAKIILHGTSMGSATVMMTTGEPLPSNVVCAVADCGYTSVWDEYSVQIGNVLGLPEMPFLHIARAAAKVMIGFDFKKTSPLEQVKKSKTPTLFIHGDKDDFVPLWMNYPLYKNASCEKERLIVPNAPHAASFVVDPKLYWSTVEKFVKKYINE